MLCPVCIFMKQVLTLLSVFKCVFFCTTMVSRPSHFFLAVMVTRCRDTVCQYYALLAAYLKTAKQRHFVIGVTDQQPFRLLFSLNQIYQQTISKLVCAGLLENPGVIIWTFGQWGGVGVSDIKKNWPLFWIWRTENAQLSLPVFVSATCGPGLFFNASQAQCLRCPVGTYQPLSGQQACIVCPDRKTTLSTARVSSSDCICEYRHFSLLYFTG